jgi:hypothetical protein
MVTPQHSRATAAVSTYREFVPQTPLRRDVLCLWTQSIWGSTGEYVPDGCIDIVLVNDDPPEMVLVRTGPGSAYLAAD